MDRTSSPSVVNQLSAQTGSPSVVPVANVPPGQTYYAAATTTTTPVKSMSPAQVGYQAPYGAYQATPVVAAAPVAATTTTTVVEGTVVTPCGSWSDFFRCPLTIFTILAVIFFIADIYAVYRASLTSTSSSFWIVAVISLLIYIGLAFLFGYWMKKKCEDCKQGQSWLLFFVAIFFPIILGLIVSVVVGAVGGGLAFLSGSLATSSGAGGKAKKANPAQNPVAGALNSAADAIQAQTQANAALAQNVLAQNAQAAAAQAQANAQAAQAQAVQNIAQNAMGGTPAGDLLRAAQNAMIL